MPSFLVGLVSHSSSCSHDIYYLVKMLCHQFLSFNLSPFPTHCESYQNLLVLV
jgi:hypothetical protein